MAELKELRAGPPLIYSSRVGRRVTMGTGCTESQLFSAGDELLAMGFTIRENRRYPPLDRRAHSSAIDGGQHYSWYGYGAFDTNLHRGGANNTWRETCALDTFAVPLLNRKGIRGLIWKPIGRPDHQSWLHADRGTYRNITTRKWTGAQVAEVRALLDFSSSGSPAGQSFDLTTAETKLLQQRIWTTPDGSFGPKTADALAYIFTGRNGRSKTAQQLGSKYGVRPNGTLSVPLVKAVQAYLNLLRQPTDNKPYFSLSIDGIAGPRTDAAVKLYITRLRGHFS